MKNTAAANDRIAWIKISSCYLPLANPISDAKVLTGRQKPMTEIAMLFVEIETVDGHQGLGFSYSKRAGGPGQFAHAKEIAPALLGEDPNDISKAWVKLCWAGASVGRSGMSVQAIGAFDVALWDMKAKRAKLSLAKLLGSERDSVRCYNTSGGFLHTPLEQLLINTTASREQSSSWASCRTSSIVGCRLRTSSVEEGAGAPVKIPCAIDPQAWTSMPARAQRSRNVPSCTVVRPSAWFHRIWASIRSR